MRPAAILAAAALSMAAWAQNPNRLYQLSELKTATLAYGGKKLKAWVMDSTAKRQEGMMFLTDREVPANGAMLFVFAGQRPLSFWMKNTLIPLDIAYLDAKGTVVSVHVLAPKDERGVPAAKPAKYALEMKRGAFKRLGIRAGTRFSIPGFVKAVD